MTEDLKTIKKGIIEEFQNTFPQLTKYSQNKLYKIAGPLIIGIELIKLPRTEEYRPYLVIYPLWEKSINSCLDSPIILKEYYNRKGLQFSIPYKKHGIYFTEVLDSIKKQSSLLLDKEISLKRLFDIINEYCKTPPLSASPNSYLQAKLQKSKFIIALLFNDNEPQKILDQINGRHWDINNFKLWNVKLNEWLQELQETINQREDLLNRVTINKQDRKLAKLKSPPDFYDPSK